MKTMKCANLHGINDLHYEEIPMPECGQDEVLVAVEPGCKMVLMGNPAGEMTLSQNTYWHILRKELTVYGT